LKRLSTTGQNQTLQALLGAYASSSDAEGEVKSDVEDVASLPKAIDQAPLEEPEDGEILDEDDVVEGEAADLERTPEAELVASSVKDVEVVSALGDASGLVQGVVNEEQDAARKRRRRGERKRKHNQGKNRLASSLHDSTYFMVK
jgi:hypothetical protein